MSFVCPNCNYRDDIRWRNAYYDPHTSIMNWDDFQIAFPELANEFLNGKRYVLKAPYAYEREPRTRPIKYIKRGTYEEFKARGLTLHLVSGYLDPGSNKARQLSKSNLHEMMKPSKAEIRQCESCGFQKIYLINEDELSECPKCKGLMLRP